MNKQQSRPQKPKQKNARIIQSRDDASKRRSGSTNLPPDQRPQAVRNHEGG